MVWAISEFRIVGKSEFGIPGIPEVQILEIETSGSRKSAIMDTRNTVSWELVKVSFDSYVQ